MPSAMTAMRPLKHRLLPFLVCLLLACLYAGAVHAGPAVATEDEADTPRTSRYGRGYEARHGIGIDTRSERVERAERFERVERVERPEKIERVERPGRVERVERIERGR